MRSLKDLLRVLKAAAAASLAALAMSSFFWMSPIAYGGFLPVKNSYEARAALQANFPTSGVYLLPDPNTPDEFGPVSAVFISGSSDLRLTVTRVLGGLFHLFLIAFLLAWAFFFVRVSLVTWGTKECVAVSLLPGLAAALLVNLTEPIWFLYPWSWHWRLALYHFLVWVAASLAAVWTFRHQPLPATT